VRTRLHKTRSPAWFSACPERPSSSAPRMKWLRFRRFPIPFSKPWHRPKCLGATAVKWFRNLKISRKLLASFALVSLFAGVARFVGITNIRKIGTANAFLYEKVTVPATVLGELNASFSRIQVSLYSVLLADNQQDIEKNVAGVRKRQQQIEALTRSYAGQISSA